MNIVLNCFNSLFLIFQISTPQRLKCINMKDELNFAYNGGGVAYLLQSVAIHFNLTVSFNIGSHTGMVRVRPYAYMFLKLKTIRLQLFKTKNQMCMVTVH